MKKYIKINKRKKQIYLCETKENGNYNDREEKYISKKSSIVLYGNDVESIESNLSKIIDNLDILYKNIRVLGKIGDLDKIEKAIDKKTILLIWYLKVEDLKKLKDRQWIGAIRTVKDITFKENPNLIKIDLYKDRGDIANFLSKWGLFSTKE